MRFIRRIAIGFGLFAAAIAVKTCVTQCLRMIRGRRARNAPVGRIDRVAVVTSAAAAA